MPRGKSDFVSALSSSSREIKRASKSQRSGGIVSDEEIIEAYDLQPGGSVVIKTRLSKAKTAVHERGTKEGLPYVTMSFVPLEEPGKGMVLSKYQGFHNRDGEWDEDNVERVMHDLQALGYDTDGFDASDIEKCCEELTEAKPEVMIALVCNKIQNGKNKGKLVVNTFVNRLASGQSTPAVDEEPEEEEQQEEPAPTSRRSRKPKSEEYVPSVGDTVICSEPGEEDWECQVTAVNSSAKTVKLDDGEFDAEDVAWSSIKKK